MLPPDPVLARLAQLRQMRSDWLKYLQHNVDIANWHGVEDAASDLRDFEAAIKELEWVQNGLR